MIAAMDALRGHGGGEVMEGSSSWRGQLRRENGYWESKSLDGNESR